MITLVQQYITWKSVNFGMDPLNSPESGQSSVIVSEQDL